MARPNKQGLDYFPLDVEMDDKFELIEANHGVAGFGIVIKLFQKIYKDGYFLKWTEETALLFSKRINVDIKEVNAVIEDCCSHQVFDKKLFTKYKILTSAGIQEHYLFAIVRRKKVNLCKAYLLTDMNGINKDINWVNDSKSTQSIVKDRKVKNRKVKKSEFIPPTLDDVKAYFKEKGYKVETAIRAFNHYEAGNWHDVNGNPVLNWKQKIGTNWFKEENKIYAEYKPIMP